MEDCLFEMELNYRDFQVDFRDSNFHIAENRIRKYAGKILEMKDMGLRKQVKVKCPLTLFPRLERELKTFCPIVDIKFIY